MAKKKATKNAGAVKKTVAKPSKKTKLSSFFDLLKSHKLVVFLLALVMLFPASFVYEKYKDWDNAQFIKGIAKDFPELVAQIEAETGLDLKQKTDCMVTQEKVGSGVRTCELLFYGSGETSSDAEEVFLVVEKNKNFEKRMIFENQEGYKFSYRNKNSCSFTNRRDVYGSCIFAIREANLLLARDVFSK